MSDPTPIKFRIPRQNLAAPTVFRATAEDAANWAQNLPIANTKLAVQKLRSAIDELNHVDMAPDVRFDIMEALRPSLRVALSTLSRRLLNQPLVMPEEPRQMSELADKLYSLATAAYIIVAVQTLQKRDSIYTVNPAKLLCESIHRALTFAGKKILQTFQLHQPVQPYGWLEIHQLYAMAERQQLVDLLVEDEQLGSSTITANYLQSLMLGCCKPTQLRQSDLACVYQALHEWGNLIHLSNCDTGEGLFRVDLGNDQPAVYSSLHPPSNDTNCRRIDTSELIAHLKTLKQGDNKEKTKFKMGQQSSILPANMRDHLIKSLGSMSTRNFKRSSSGELLGVSLGLSSTHYHIAGRKTFAQILAGTEYTQPMNNEATTRHFLDKPDSRDNWEQANPHDDHTRDEAHNSYHGELVNDPALALLEEGEANEVAPEERYPVIPVHMIDASPGGYCLEWAAELPTKARSGDIIGVRESGRSEWILAVIRWVSQLKDVKALIGVELMSPKAIAYGARIQQVRNSEAPIMRVLLLPEIKLVGQPHTLITPRAGFKEQQKVTLIREGEEFLIQLLRQISTTGNFSQFDFRYIKHIEETIAEDKSVPLESAYDSLWNNL